MKTVKQVLTEARELISDKSRWTQQASARDGGGNWVAENSARACQWCAQGAVYCVGGTGPAMVSTLETAFRLLAQASPVGSGNRVVRTNDELGHEATLAMFDRAIAAAGDQ